MNTNKTKTFSMFLLGAILVAGTISTMIPTSLAQSQYAYVPQQEYTGYENSYGKDYDKKQGTDVNIQKVKCNNIIINGVEKSRPTPGDMTGNAMAADEENDWIGQQQSQGFTDGEKKFNGIDKNIVNVCINKNNQVVEVVVPPEPLTCEECFIEFATPNQIRQILGAFEASSIQQLCDEFLSGTFGLGQIETIFENAGVEDVDGFIDCLLLAGLSIPID